MARIVSTRRLSPALLLCLWGCGDNAPREQLPANIVIERILAHCHGARSGQFENCTFELRSSGQAMRYCSLETPDLLRLSVARGRQTLVDGERAWTWLQTGDPIEAAGQELADLTLLNALVQLMFLAPLYGNRNWQRIDGNTLTRTSGDGDVWRLEYHPDLFEPIKLTGPRGEVEFLETTSGTTRIPTRMRLGRLGEYAIKVVSAGQSFAPGMFELPNQRSSIGRTFVYGSTPKPKVPEFQKSRPSQWLIFPDPEDWDARRSRYETLGRMLYEAGQTNAGDPMFFLEDDAAYMAIPFKPKDDQEQQTFTPEEGQVVRKVDSHTTAVVYAPTGEFAERIAAGRKLLEEFLADRSMVANGPLRMAVNFYSSVDPRNPEDRRRMPLRLELPVAH